MMTRIPKDGYPKVEVDDDFGEMMIYAERYACGRRTYAVDNTIRYIIGVLPHLSNRDVKVMYRDISSLPDTFMGDECDVRNWRAFEAKLKDEIDKRGLEL